jgi:cytochrome c-type biogenesis protein CcmH/NrfG
MRSDSVVFGVAGIFFGVLVGWIIGSQQASGVVPPPAPAAAAASGAQGGQSAPPVFDESRAASLKATADRSPSDVESRIQLGNLYFDAERTRSHQWAEAALKVDPKNVTRAGSRDRALLFQSIDRALAQFDRSLAIDPTHSKTLLNIGTSAPSASRFGRRREGVAAVLDVAPNSQKPKPPRRA